jgi:hypothetical protein
MKKILLLEDYLNLGSQPIKEDYDREFIEESLVISEAEDVLDSIFEKDEEGGLKKFAKGLMSFFKGDVKKIRTLGNELKGASVDKVKAKYETEEKKRKIDTAEKDGKLEKDSAKQKKDDLTSLQKDREAALTGKISDIKSEIDQIASDAGTGTADKAASAVKVAASLAANRELLKYIEDKEEKTTVLTKIKDQTSTVKDIQKELQDDVKQAKAGKPEVKVPPKKEPDATAEKPKDEKPEVKVPPKKEPEATAEKPKEEPKEKPEVKVPPKKEPEKKSESPDEKTGRVRQELTNAQNDLRDAENSIDALEKRIKQISAGNVKFKSEEERNKARKDLILKIDSIKADIPDLKDNLKKATEEWQKDEVEISRRTPKNKPEAKVPPKKEPEPKKDRNFTYKDVNGKTKYVTAEDVDKAKEKVKKFNADIDLSTLKEA